jgi:hypothetical protein
MDYERTYVGADVRVRCPFVFVCLLYGWMAGDHTCIVSAASILLDR